MMGEELTEEGGRQNLRRPMRAATAPRRARWCSAEVQSPSPVLEPAPPSAKVICLETHSPYFVGLGCIEMIHLIGYSGHNGCNAYH